MANRDRRKIDFEGLYEKGSNPNGFTSQTANGTAHAFGTGWNKDYCFEHEQLPPDATRPAGRSSRTGE